MNAKQGVDMRWLSAPAWYGAWQADQLHIAKTGQPATITSTGEGKHRAHRSAHYAGGYLGHSRAFDLRIWAFTGTGEVPAPAAFAKDLQDALGDDYQVILEADHIHVEWQPVYDGG